jgi:Na+/serine symporter
MSASPILTVILVMLGAHYFVALVNRIFRHWNIRKHGYPPAHCDADGDFRQDSE